MREYLAALNGESIADTRQKISPVGPQARWTVAAGGPAFYAYSTNYLIDVEHSIILDTRATPAYRSDEAEITKVMLERVETCFDLKPARLIGDTAYGIAPMLGWPVGRRRGDQRTGESVAGVDSGAGMLV